MKSYSEFIDRILRSEKLLEKLTPSEPLDWDLARVVREADDAKLAGGKQIGNAAAFALIRGGLLYALDALEPAHAIFQEAHGDLGSYWHGMMHRREADFDNARYWFRRAGTLPFFGALHGAASAVSSDMARQSNWDPYLFTGQCEQARFGAEELVGEMAKLQRIEFEVLFDYCWRQAVPAAGSK
jgi:hypothetical protein